MADNFDKWDQQELAKDRTETKKEKDDRKQFKSALKNRRNEFRKRVKEEEGIGTKSRQRERFKTPLTKAEQKSASRIKAMFSQGIWKKKLCSHGPLQGPKSTKILGMAGGLWLWMGTCAPEAS